MAEFLHFIQFTVINYAFIFVLIVVTIDNLIPKLNLTVIFNSIRIFLIAFAVIYTLYLYYPQSSQGFG